MSTFIIHVLRWMSVYAISCHCEAEASC